LTPNQGLYDSAESKKDIGEKHELYHESPVLRAVKADYGYKIKQRDDQVVDKSPPKGKEDWNKRRFHCDHYTGRSQTEEISVPELMSNIS
jgi:hypothetical protein